MAKLHRTLYRALLKEASQINKNKPYVLLWSTIDASKWGKCFSGGDKSENQDFFGLNLPNGLKSAFQKSRIDWPYSPIMERQRFNRFFRTICRKLGGEYGDNALDFGFDGLRILQDIVISSTSYDILKSEEGIYIACMGQLIQKQEDGSDAFAYKLLILNDGVGRVQLLGRHWIFVDSKGESIEVPKFENGVVGQKPIIKPQHWFEYYSGVSLKGGAPGTMEGAFLFTRGDTSFEVPTPKISLI